SVGAQTTLLGMIGEDSSGETFHRLIEETCNLTGKLLSEKGRPTILKSRAVAQGQQMLRLDREVPSPVAQETHIKALEIFRSEMEHCGGVSLSDYGKGCLTSEFIAEMIRSAKATGVAVIVDPKGQDYLRYQGATMLTPNRREA